MRAARTRDRGHDFAHVEAERVRIDRAGALIAPQPVLLGVGLDERDAVLVAAGLAQVAQRFAVDGEESAGRAVFGRHVGDGGAVGERQAVEAGSVELHEFADHALGAEHLHDLEHEIGSRRAFDHPSGQLEADDFGNQHRDRLAEHGGLGLDAADPPAEHGHAVDHGGVAVGAHQRVRVGDGLAVLVGVGPDGLGEALEIDLVADAGARRHHAEIVEGGLAPFEELVALHVALVFALDVHAQGARIAELVDHDRVVDHEIHRAERVDPLRVAVERSDSVAHRCEVDHRGHAGEVLHQHPRRPVGDLAGVVAAHGGPVGKGPDVVLRDGLAVLKAEHVLEHDPQRGGQAREVAEAGSLGGGDGVEGDGLACRLESPAGSGRIAANGDGHCSIPSVLTRRAAAVSGQLYAMGHNGVQPGFSKAASRLVDV